VPHPRRPAIQPPTITLPGSKPLGKTEKSDISDSFEQWGESDESLNVSRGTLAPPVVTLEPLHNPLGRPQAGVQALFTLRMVFYGREGQNPQNSGPVQNLPKITETPSYPKTPVLVVSIEVFEKMVHDVRDRGPTYSSLGREE